MHDGIHYTYESSRHRLLKVAYVKNGKIVGIADITDQGNIVNINQLRVQRKHRGKSYGSALVKAVKKHAQRVKRAVYVTAHAPQNEGRRTMTTPQLVKWYMQFGLRVYEENNGYVEMAWEPKQRKK